MKKLIIIFMFVSCPMWATWTQVQTKVNTACGNVSSCAVTVSSTGANHLIVVGAMVCCTQVTIASVSGGGTYTLCGTNCQGGDSTAGFTDAAYTLSSVSGATSVTINLSGTPGNGVLVWVQEYSTTSGPPIFDASGKSHPTACTSCAGATLTLGGTNDVIVQFSSCGGSCSAVTTYAADNAFPTGDGLAHLINTSSGAAPNWTQSPSSSLAGAALAFKETSAGGGGKSCTLGTMGAGACYL